MDRREILACTVDELKAQLSHLQLNTQGRKPELQKRLLDHYNFISDEEEMFSQAQESASTDKRSIFTLKDIQESLVPFNGTGYPDVEQWIIEFEDNATVVEWTDIQMYIYAKQLLTGAAQIFIRSQKNIHSWLKLKESLKKEFGKKLSTIEIHKILNNRKKRHNETFLEYLYTIIEISYGTNLDDESVIEYFINGIQDNSTNKNLLYEARSIEELKQKIRVYEKLRTSRHQNPCFERSKYNRTYKKCIKCPHLSNHTTQECRKFNTNCFNCNEQGHSARYCPHKNSSQNTFRNSYQNQQQNVPQNRIPPQNKFPSQNYNRSNNNNKNSNSNNNFNPGLTTRLAQSAIRIYKKIKIGHKEFDSLLDTGRDICLLTKSNFDKLKNIKLIDETTYILGIAQQRMNTLGYIETEIEADNIKFPCVFHIANDEDLGVNCILGNDILRQININITADGAHFSANTDFDGLSKTYNLDFTAGKVFKIICAQDIEEEFKVNIPQTLPRAAHLKLKHIIKNYKPEQTEDSPIKMSIIITDDIPVFQHPRRISLTDQKIVETQINEWLAEGILRRSNSQYASPIVLVSKKDNSKRLCCDYRKVNEKIVRDNFPMLLIDDALQKLEGLKIFTTIDLKNGFFHVPMEDYSKKYTSFVTHHGQFEFNFVPFCISNSPAVFCRYISIIFQDMIISNKIIAYMDDIILVVCVCVKL